MVAAIVIGAVYYFTIFDNGAAITAQIEASRGELQTEEQKKKETEATLQEEKRMKEAIVILSEKYQVISKKLPTYLNHLDISSAVETYARSANVRIVGTKQANPEPMEVVEEVPLEVTVEGKFSEILQFIYYVSVAERLTQVRSMTLDPVGPAESFSGNLRFQGVISGYKLASGKSAPKVKGE